jgi:hypothetical protein
MDIPNHDELLAKVEDFCARHDMAETGFGRRAINNPNFISGLRRDPPVSPTLKTLCEVVDFMERTDAAAKANPPPLKLTSPPGDEEELALPFSKAPVSTTGGCSPISSSTIGPAPTPRASASCPCSEADGQAAAPNLSCSADAVSSEGGA